MAEPLLVRDAHEFCVQLKLSHVLPEANSRGEGRRPRGEAEGGWSVLPLGLQPGGHVSQRCAE